MLENSLDKITTCYYNIIIISHIVRNLLIHSRRKIMDKKIMSVQELAAQMGISLPKAYELVKQPGFPRVRVGSRILIPVEEFNIWLREQTQCGDA